VNASERRRQRLHCRYGHADQCVRLTAWRFLLVFCSNRAGPLNTPLLSYGHRTDRRTDGRTTDGSQHRLMPPTHRRRGIKAAENKEAVVVRTAARSAAVPLGLYICSVYGRNCAFGIVFIAHTHTHTHTQERTHSDRGRLAPRITQHGDDDPSRPKVKSVR